MGSVISRAKQFCLLRVLGLDLSQEHLSSDCVTILVEDDEYESRSINSESWVNIAGYIFYIVYE